MGINFIICIKILQYLVIMVSHLYAEIRAQSQLIEHWACVTGSGFSIPQGSLLVLETESNLYGFCVSSKPLFLTIAFHFGQNTKNKIKLGMLIYAEITTSKASYR